MCFYKTYLLETLNRPVRKLLQTEQGRLDVKFLEICKCKILQITQKKVPMSQKKVNEETVNVNPQIFF